MASVVANCDDIVAHLPGVKAEVYATAKEGASRAEGVLRAHQAHHRDDDDLGHSRITVTRGSLDAFVNLDDTRGDHAAAAIEYGRTKGKHGVTQGINALGSAF